MHDITIYDGAPTIDFVDLPKAMSPYEVKLYDDIKQNNLIAVRDSLTQVIKRTRLPSLQDEKGNTILHAIVEVGIIDQVNKADHVVGKMLSDDITSLDEILNTKNQDGLTPLELEAKNGSNNLLSALMLNIVDKSKIIQLLKKPLMDYYVKSGNLDALKKISNNGIPLNTLPTTDKLMLITACRFNKIQVIQYLLSIPEILRKINEPDYQGNSAIHHVGARGNSTLTSLLLASHANPYINNHSGRNAYYFAKAYYESKKKTNGPNDGLTTLKTEHKALAQRFFQTVGVINEKTTFNHIEQCMHGCNDGHLIPVDIRDNKDNNTLLMKAAQVNNTQLILELLKRDADRWKKDKSGPGGLTAKDFASTNGHKDAVTLLDTGIISRLSVFSRKTARNIFQPITYIQHTLGLG